MFSVYHTLLASISQRRSKGPIMLFFFKNGSWELFATREQSIVLFMKIFTFRTRKKLGTSSLPQQIKIICIHSISNYTLFLFSLVTRFPTKFTPAPINSIFYLYGYLLVLGRHVHFQGFWHSDTLKTST